MTDTEKTLEKWMVMWYALVRAKTWLWNKMQLAGCLYASSAI